MNIIAVIIVSLTATLAAANAILLRRERRSCQKYPFYKLRDDIIYSIITSEAPEKYYRVYKVANGTISQLKKFNFTFYSYSMARFLDDLLEEGHKCNFDADHVVRVMGERYQKMNEHEKTFGRLILKTAKQNSIRLRFAMTRLGQWLLLEVHSYQAVARLFARHPELLKTAQEYSAVSATLRPKTA